MGKPLVDHFYHLFPALDGTLHPYQLDEGVREDTYSHIRAENQLVQERLHVWTKLDRVICDVRMLYVLSLRCPVRLVMLDYATVDDQRCAADALRENPVPRLKLTIGHGPDKMFDGLFSPELTGKLTHLTLCLLYTNWIDADSPNGRAPGLQRGNVLEKIVPMLRPLHRLTRLRIVIHGGAIVYRNAPSPVVLPSEYALTFRESVFDVDGTAASLVSLFPCLRYLFPTTSGRLSNWDDSDSYGGTKRYERWDVLRAWRITDQKTLLDRTQDGERILLALHDEVAGTIIRQEDLVLSESDEATIQHRRRFE